MVNQVEARMIAGLGSVSSGVEDMPRLSMDITTPLTFIGISAGACRDRFNTVLITGPSPVRKNIAAPWTSGNGGGLGDGSPLTVGLGQHLFIMLNPTTGAVDYLRSLTTAPTLPAGFTKYRRLGAVMLNQSGQICPFVQHGNEFSLKTQIRDYTNAPNGFGPYTRKVSIPQGQPMKGRFRFDASGANSGTFYSGVYDPACGAPDFSPSLVTQWAQYRGASVYDVSGQFSRYQSMVIESWTNANAEVITKANDTGDILSLGVLGWTDLINQYG